MVGDIHVTPTDDFVGHEVTDGCVCGPEARPIVRDDGSVGWMLVHHSLDGRELRE